MKTRIRERQEGGQEIIRLISPDDLLEPSGDDPLFFEKSIVWLEDLGSVQFVRVKAIRTAQSRRGPLHLGGNGRVVGYSKLTPDAPRDAQTGGYVRRVFFLRASDVETPCAEIPSEAIDPRTVLPGQECTPLMRAR